MNTFPIPSDYAPFSGVKTIPPPPKLIPNLQHDIANALTQLQGKERIAAVGVGTRDAKTGIISYNFLVVGRLPTGKKKWDLSAGLWFGSKWGESVEGTAFVRWAM